MNLSDLAVFVLNLSDIFFYERRPIQAHVGEPAQRMQSVPNRPQKVNG